MNTIQYLSTIKGCRMKKKCLHPVYAPSTHHTRHLSVPFPTGDHGCPCPLYPFRIILCIYLLKQHIYVSTAPSFALP